MDRASDFAKAALYALGDRPRSVFKGACCAAHLEIPDYVEHFATHYKLGMNEARKVLGFAHFGVVVEFDQPTEIKIHDEEGALGEDLRALMARFGPVLLRNVLLPEGESANAQRNIFPDRKFHIDRAGTQAEQISMFWRDPLDPVQRAPRSSSTLILPNAAARLQAVEEGHREYEPARSYEFFADTDISGLIGKVLLELPWDAPAGVGEISLLDNRTVMHASYYPRSSDKGYPISVRYLS